MKKRWIVGMTLLVLFFGGAIKCSAAESKEYKSNGVAGFYGTYEYSTDSTTEPSTTTEPSKKSEPKNRNNAPNSEETSQKNLPKTGEQSNNKWVYLGILVLLLLFLLLIYKRKGDKK
ncbi:LPXTG cell wall anchor domain-containing protein [Enterococcus sp. 22-H-5-01]|uniref:LPXTG cell wall anchor domain-containing protein n=1 Tax=Enterococcus sp. 22-H-5-01 TaxID=3418555 RepID=UPI003CFD5C90